MRTIPCHDESCNHDKDLTHADPRGTRVAPTGEWRFWVGTAADGAKVDANVTRVLLTSALPVEVQP